MSDKITFAKPGNFLYPVPAVLVSCGDYEGESNLITLAWAGTICSEPPMVSISIRPQRHSYAMIKESGEFVINLTTKELTYATDRAGCTTILRAPLVKESPVNLECKVRQILPLGTHDLFLAEVVSVQVDAAYLDDKGVFHMEQIPLIAYSHGKYHALGEILGSFGFSVKKR